MLAAPRLTAALAVLMGSLALASPTPLDVDKRQSAPCAPVHLFVARGTTELPGDGSIGSLAQLVLQANPGATKESIDYPANTDPTYIASVTSGIEAVTEQVTSYVSACPNSTLVLIGYSQGAQIILNALCGSGSPQLGGTGEPTITSEQGANSESPSITMG
jgi:acetylxylan esterase